ncbi:2-oxoglutarate dehydrogenase [Chitinibacter bivalviorum]|uniref:2-oxoglutarate dehydrogenase n=1 Tax=Chitinibacter bivalviorum TaxID=2739434 RepID=A0A7H9BLS8_9NEIS|nr:cystatin domain-containing protein [Chitinibacter bivalviorum]QLG89001.1 2-oxoglutarate dehydrogenase [Chitinibacter bivalviorum]
MKQHLTAFLGIALLAACSQNPVTSTPTVAKCQPSEMAGSYRVQEAITPEAKEALATVLAQMNTSAKLKNIIEVRTQVVAGTNYAITFELDNGEVWHAIVWHDLQGKYTMTQPASKKPFAALCP